MTSANTPGAPPPGAVEQHVIERNDEEKAEMHRWKVDVEDRLKRLEAQVETIRKRREHEGHQWP